MEEKNKHIRYYILFDNHTQGMMLHELLDKQGLPNRIAPAPRDTDGKAACGMALPGNGKKRKCLDGQFSSPAGIFRDIQHGSGH